VKIYSRAKSHVVLGDEFEVAGAGRFSISAGTSALLGGGEGRVLLQLVGLLTDTGEGIVAEVRGRPGETEAGASAGGGAAEARGETDAAGGAAQGVVLDQAVAAAEKVGAAVFVAVPPRRGRR